LFYAIEHGHPFHITDVSFDEHGHRIEQKRAAFADELTEPQLSFLFHAKEQRKKMRQEGSGVSKNPAF
jgi:hypothetical protein